MIFLHTSRHPPHLRGQVTCGVSTKALEQVLKRTERMLDAGGVRARLITSGTGNWRFLDIVAQVCAVASSARQV